MAPTTPTGVPSELTAGDSWIWRIADQADYPQSEGWALKYELNGKVVLHDIDAEWQTSGDDAGYWLVTIAPASTADMEKGRYTLVGRMVGSGDYANREYTVSQTSVVVKQNPRTAIDADFQSHNERTLAILEAAIEGRLTADIQSYQVAGRAVAKIPMTELVQLRATYAAAVHQERTGTFGRRIDVSFVPVR